MDSNDANFSIDFVLWKVLDWWSPTLVMNSLWFYRVRSVLDRVVSVTNENWIKCAISRSRVLSVNTRGLWFSEEGLETRHDWDPACVQVHGWRSCRICDSIDIENVTPVRLRGSGTWHNERVLGRVQRCYLAESTREDACVPLINVCSQSHFLIKQRDGRINWKHRCTALVNPASTMFPELYECHREHATIGSLEFL